MTEGGSPPWVLTCSPLMNSRSVPFPDQVVAMCIHVPGTMAAPPWASRRAAPSSRSTRTWPPLWFIMLKYCALPPPLAPAQNMPRSELLVSVFAQIDIVPAVSVPK